MTHTPSASLELTSRAVHRLGVALDRLEAASSHATSGDFLLAGQLRDAGDDNDRLAQVTRTVGLRLDQTIDRLRLLLED